MFDKNYISISIAVTCIKLLFIPMYRSTDFEVHRNWMAITYQTNISTWYQEETSEWTLDYPPFFAWFEYFLSHIAKLFDPRMLEVTNLNYISSQTIFFQRLSVIISDIVYMYGVSQLCKLYRTETDRKRVKLADDPWIHRDVVLFMMLLWNPGLLMVDHIHFQYNGFLNGMLFLSISFVKQKQYIKAAIWYLILINFKHIYLYLAPAYFVFFLRNYCFKEYKSGGSPVLKSFSMKNFLKLVSVVVGIFLLSFGPFMLKGQTLQILRRLFPVKRGLTHAYWAPNFWALYNFADRCIAFTARLLGFSFDKSALETGMTKGLVQDFKHAVLPTVSPTVSLLLTILSIMPFMTVLWKKKESSVCFVQSLILCSFGSFLFGWHVHEKAILMIILPLAILAVSSKQYAQNYMFLIVLGHFSLFPLLHKEAETPVKILLLLLHSVYSYTSLKSLHKSSYERTEWTLLTATETIFLSGVPILQVLHSYGLRLLGLEDKLPFLPLMMISVYCSLGVLYCWVKYCFITLPYERSYSTSPEIMKILSRASPKSCKL